MSNFKCFFSQLFKKNRYKDYNFEYFFPLNYLVSIIEVKLGENATASVANVN